MTYEKTLEFLESWAVRCCKCPEQEKNHPAKHLLCKHFGIYMPAFVNSVLWYSGLRCKFQEYLLPTLPTMENTVKKK